MEHQRNFPVRVEVQHRKDAVSMVELSSVHLIHWKILFPVMGQRWNTPVWGKVHHRKGTVSTMELFSVPWTL